MIKKTRAKNIKLKTRLGKRASLGVSPSFAKGHGEQSKDTAGKKKTKKAAVLKKSPAVKRVANPVREVVQSLKTHVRKGKFT